MNATSCRTCKGTIARHIKRCPHCGESYPDSSDIRPSVRVGFGFIPIIGASKRTIDERKERNEMKEREESLKKVQEETESSFLTHFVAVAAVTTLIGWGIDKLLEKKD